MNLQQNEQEALGENLKHPILNIKNKWGERGRRTENVPRSCEWVNGWKQESSLKERKLGIMQKQTYEVDNITAVMCNMQLESGSARFLYNCKVQNNVAPRRFGKKRKKAFSGTLSDHVCTYLCWNLPTQSLLDCLKFVRQLSFFFFNMQDFNCVKISYNKAVLCQSHSTLNKTNYCLPLPELLRYKHSSCFSGHRVCMAAHRISKIFPYPLISRPFLLIWDKKITYLEWDR